MASALVGKLLRWVTGDGEGEEDGGTFIVSRFTDDLGNGFYLARRLCPVHGEDLGLSHIVSLEAIADNDAAAIFDSWEDLPALVDDDEDEVPAKAHRH